MSIQILSDRVAYLKGLAEGLKVDESSTNGRLIGAIIDVLDDFAKAVIELKDKHAELDEYVESIDEDLSELEEALMDDIDDDDDDLDDDGSGGDMLDRLIEYDCPHCGTTTYFDSESFDLADENKCSKCGKSIFDEGD